MGASCWQRTGRDERSARGVVRALAVCGAVAARRGGQGRLAALARVMQKTMLSRVRGERFAAGTVHRSGPGRPRAGGAARAHRVEGTLG